MLQMLEIDRLRQEKEAIEMQHRVTERELVELKEKLAASNRSLGSASGNIAQQESLICQLRGNFLVLHAYNNESHFLPSEI